MTGLPTYRKKIDDADGVRFLAAFAEVLPRRGLLSPHYVQDVRDFLSIISRSPSDSPWEAAISQCDFVALLQVRYGAYRISQNFFHLTLRPLLQEAMQQWRHFGAALSEKVPAHLTRSFICYAQQGVEGDAGYAEVLLELAHAIEQGCKGLQRVAGQMARWMPHALAGALPEEVRADQELAEALGFEEVETRLFSVVWVTHAHQELVAIYRRFTDWVEAVLLRMGVSPHGALGVNGVCWAHYRGLRVAIQQMEGVAVSPEAGLLEQEQVRVSYLVGFLRMQDAMGQVQATLLEIMSREGSVELGKVPVSRAVERRLWDTLMGEGVPLERARAAVQALLGYCVTHGISPHEVLPGELGQIHVALSPQCLQQLQEHAQSASIRRESAGEKERCLSSAASLLERFSVLLSLGFLVIGMWGCGVKTLPKSDALQLQPDIPFHEIAPKSVTTKKDLTRKKETTDESTQKSSDPNRRLDRDGHPL